MVWGVIFQLTNTFSSIWMGFFLISHWTTFLKPFLSHLIHNFQVGCYCIFFSVCSKLFFSTLKYWVQIDWGIVFIVLKTNPHYSSLRPYFCIVLSTKVWKQFITFDAVLEHILQRNQGHTLCSHKWTHCTEHQSISNCVVLGPNESFWTCLKYHKLAIVMDISQGAYIYRLFSHTLQKSRNMNRAKQVSNFVLIMQCSM